MTLRRIKAEDSRIKSIAESMLSQLKSERKVSGATDDMYTELVAGDETILRHLDIVTEYWKN